jgi:hypothetical protein
MFPVILQLRVLRLGFLFLPSSFFSPLDQTCNCKPHSVVFFSVFFSLAKMTEERKIVSMDWDSTTLPPTTRSNIIVRLCTELDRILLPVVSSTELKLAGGSKDAWVRLDEDTQGKLNACRQNTEWDRCWSIWRIWRTDPEWIRKYKGGVTRCAREANNYHRCAKKRSKAAIVAGIKVLRQEQKEEEMDLNDWFDCAFHQLCVSRETKEDMHPVDVQLLLRYMTQNLGSSETGNMADACALVARVTDGNAGNWIQIANGGGIALVLQALHRHLNNADVVENACRALSTQSSLVEFPNAVFSSSSSSSSEEVEEANEEDEVDQKRDKEEKGDNNEGETQATTNNNQNNPFLALATAVHSPVLIAKLGGIPLLFGVLSCQNSPRVGGAALRALAGLLTVCDDNQLDVARGGGVAVLADWLDRACALQPEFDEAQEQGQHEKEKEQDEEEEKKDEQEEGQDDEEEDPEDWTEVARWACWAVAQLAEGCTETKEVKQALVLHNVASLLLEAVRVFSSDADVVRHALWALVPLFADDALRPQCIRHFACGDAFLQDFFDVAGDHTQDDTSIGESLWQLVVVLSKSLAAPMADGEEIGHAFVERVQPWLEENFVEGDQDQETVRLKEKVNRFLAGVQDMQVD